MPTVARILEAEASINKALSQFGQNLYDAFAKDAVAAETSEAIAESLTKKILVTRPATREEATNAIVVRQATSAELRSKK